jgi:replicative DNA helicase
MSFATEPTPPHNIEAERMFLGAIFYNPQIYYLSSIKSNFFYVREHALIHEYMGQCLEKKSVLEPVVLSAMMGDKLDSVSGLDYLFDLASATVIDYKPYEEIVEETYHRRALLRHIKIIEAECMSTENTVEEVVTKYLEFGTNTGRSSCTGLIKGAFDRAVEQKITPKVFHGTKFRDIDHFIKGYRKGELITIGARPSVGKSVFILNLMGRLIKPNVKCCLFSTEMMAQEVIDRFICMRGGISIEELEAQTDDAYNKIGERFMQITDGYEINVYDYIPSFSFVIGAIRREASLGTQVFFIDYLQQISNKGKHGSLAQEVGDMTTRLKLIANELGVCIVLAAQLNREAERRPDKRPMISDLRESGNIEQDSDVVILLHDESKHDDVAPKHILDLIIAKNRH